MVRYFDNTIRDIFIFKLDDCFYAIWNITAVSKLNFWVMVLDGNGFNRFVVGDQATDPNIGERIGTQTGLICNDEEGFERGGFGLIKAGDKYRVVTGINLKQGKAGLFRSLFDDEQSAAKIFGCVRLRNYEVRAC